MKTASIERISGISVHNNANSLEIAKILGWTVVVKKGEFRAGDLVCYIAVDSQVEERPEYEFLRNKRFRVKTIKLRGQYSQGLCVPVSLIKDGDLTEGRDVSEILGVSHYSKPISVQLSGEAKGNFPSFLVKTDQDNLFSHPRVLEELKDVPVYKSVKYDGSSFTCYFNEGFGVCSRNINLKEGDSKFWQIARKYDLETILKNEFANTGRKLAIQGELVGPGIQKNTLGLTDYELRIFDVFDIEKHAFFDYQELCIFCKNNNLPMVKVIDTGFIQDINFLREEANNLVYEENKAVAEGFIIKPLKNMYSSVLSGRMSVKAISQKYCLKHDE